MRKLTSCSVLLVSFAVLLVGCGGGMSSPNQPPAPNMVQALLTILDNLPMGVTCSPCSAPPRTSSLGPETAHCILQFSRRWLSCRAVWFPKGRRSWGQALLKTSNKDTLSAMM